MKKLFPAILIFALTTVSVLSAKSEGYPDFTIGPRGGLNILTSDYSDFLDPGPQIGISGRKFFEGGLYAGGMLVYNTFGKYSEEVFDDNEGETVEASLTYWDVTLAVTGGYTLFNPVESITPFIEMNIGLSYYQQEYSDPNNKITVGPSDWLYISPAFGISVPLSSSIYITARASYSLTIQSGESTDGNFHANTLNTWGTPEAGLTEYQYVTVVAGIEFAL